MTLQAITVLGHDRPGIIAETTRILADLGLNLEDSTMTLLRGHFAMTLVCAGDTASADVEAALAPLGADGTLTVAVRDPGIVSRVAGEVARVGGNITDLTTRLAGALYVLVAEVDLPAAVDVDALQASLRSAAAELGVDVGLREVESDEL